MGMLGVTGYGNKEVINVHILALGKSIYLDPLPKALQHHSHNLEVQVKFRRSSVKVQVKFRCSISIFKVIMVQSSHTKWHFRALFMKLCHYFGFHSLCFYCQDFGRFLLGSLLYELDQGSLR